MKLPPLTRRQWLATLVAGGGALAVGFGWRRLRSLRPSRLLLVLPLEAESWPGFSSAQEGAFRLLLLVVLGAVTDQTLVRLDGVPSAGVRPMLPGSERLHRIHARRTHDSLTVIVETLALDGTPLEREEFNRENPAQALQDALVQGVSPVVKTRFNDLLPRDANTFWKLVEAFSLRQEAEKLPDAMALMDRMGGEQLVRLLRADILFRLQHHRPGIMPDGARAALFHSEALVREAPWFADAWYQMAQLHTDMGQHRQALETLRRARLAKPANHDLLMALCYAARTSGLLELALRAFNRRLQLVPEVLQPAMAENTLLYLGDLEGYERTLNASPSHWRASIVTFYQGYVRLLQGRRGEAIEAFRTAETHQSDFLRFYRLARAFRLAIEGEVRAAHGALEELVQSRSGLQAVDGEFTFKLAELAMLNGEAQPAVDLAIKAFAQGFACTRWYQRSPLLAGLQDIPRYRSLVETMRQRQKLLEATFSPAVFGL